MIMRYWSLSLRVLLALALFIALTPSVRAAPHTGAKLNAALGVNQRVLDFRLSPDGSRIAYRVARTLPPAQDNPPPPPADLFSVPATGGTAVQLNPTATVEAESVTSYQFSPDGAHIIYLRTTTDATVGNVFELFSIPTDGSAPPVSVSGPISIGNRSVRDFSFTFNQANILPALGDGSVRSVNFNVRNTTVPERISSIQDGTSNTFFFGEQVNNLLQTPQDGSVRRINPGLTSGGAVYDFEIAPDGTRAIYRADQNLDGTIELYSVPADGSDVGFRISGPLVAGGDVLQFKVNTASSRAVYLADQTTNGVVELYSARTNGGIVTKLNAPLTGGGAVTDFQFSPDGNLVVYLADQQVDQKPELFAVAATGSAATLLSGGLFGGSVRYFLISPDGSRVFYVDTAGTGGLLALISRPLALGLTVPTGYSGPPVANLTVPDLKISADSSHLVYLADNGNDGVYELASIALTPTPTVTPQINASLVPGGNIRAFQISPDGQRVVYAADQNTANVVELFSVPIDGGPVDQVSGPLTAGGNVLAGPLDFQFSPDGSVVYYLADQETDDVTELFAAYPAPVVEFSQASYVVIEGSDPAALAVRRSGKVLAPSGVRVQLTGLPGGGTAKGGAGLNVPGVDFVDNARDVAFAAGEISKTFPVAINDDGLAEAAETFTMQLFEPTQAVIGPQDTAQVAILDTAGAPLIDDAALVLPENSANNTQIPFPADAQVAATTATTYTIVFGNTNNAFLIDNTGALFVNNSAALNYETSPTFVLGIEARDSNGSFDAATWTVGLQDQNEPPVFANQTRSISENSLNGSLVGLRLVATDPDGDQLTFSATSAVFNLLANGQLTVKDGAKLDFETQKQHTLNVTVTDGSGLSKSATVTVNVLDVAEGDPTTPVIAALSPGSVVAGGKDFKLVVTGKNFTAKSVVRWNGSNRTTVLDKDRLIALITAKDIAAATTAKVDVLDASTMKTSDTVAFAVTIGKVGIAALTVEPSGTMTSTVGQVTVFHLDWTHTSQPWRAMNEMDLRLIDGEQIALWVRYQEARDENDADASTVILLNPDGTPAGSGRFGEAKVLENDTVRLDLAQASFTGSGVTGSNVVVHLPVTFKRAAARSDAYTIEMFGVDDLGGEQGPNVLGAWNVTGAHLYMPNVQR